MSFLTHLECSICHRKYSVDCIQTFCLDCKAPLLAIYNLSDAKKQLDRDRFRYRSRGIWRWHELLPLFDLSLKVTLGEGDTPILKLDRLGLKLGIKSLFVKDESFNPTGTFKARGMSVAISKAKELGIKKLIVPTAGNAGGALAAYSARAGLEACIFLPKDAPISNIEESRVTGAAVFLVEGLINDAAQKVADKVRFEGWYDMSTFKEPYRCEGKKIMGYELAEWFGWHLPDVIIYPTGGGTGLAGMWKAFNELQMLGWLEDESLPKFVAVQSEGCAPFVRAFQSYNTHCDFWENAHTIASGLRVPKSFADRLILQNIRESKGTAIAVSDNEIIEAQKELATFEGIFASPEGAATLAGLKKLLENHWINRNEKIVLFNTGMGLKYIKF